MSTHTLIGQATSVNGAELDIVIGQLLGQGLGYNEWKMKLESLGGFTWTENLKNIIIKKEFSFFKEEILTLQSEPNTAHGLKTKTNSLESILKRLQGLEWIKGVPGETEKRKRDGRLLGKDAKARCLQYHVSRWKAEAASSAQQPSPKLFSSIFSERIPNTYNTEATSTTVSNTDMSAAEVISAGENHVTEHLSNHRNLPVAKSLSPQTSFNFSNSGISSIFGKTVPLPDFDPTLSGDYQIPWVPLTSADETEQHGADIPLEDFFRFFEQDPEFSSEAAPQEPSFELPRTHGINDSYSTYIAQAIQDPVAQTTMLEEIGDFYGSQASKDTWRAGVAQENVRISSDFYLEQPQNHFRPQCSQENFGVSPQDLTRNDYRTATNIDQCSQSIDTEIQSLGSIFSLEDSHKQNEEKNQSISPNRNESVSLASSTAKLHSQSFPDSSLCTGIVLGPQSKPLIHASEKLRRKRRELAAAQITISKLLAEIKWLEASAERESATFEEMALEDTLGQRGSQKRGNDEILHGRKRPKETKNAWNSNWRTSTPPIIEDRETNFLTVGHHFTEKDSFTPTRKIFEAAVQHSSDQIANETKSVYAAISSAEAPKPFLAHATQAFGGKSLCVFKKTSSPFDLQAERCTSVQYLSAQTLPPYIAI